MTVKIGDTGEKTGEGEIIRMRKKLVACLQASALQNPCNYIYLVLLSYLTSSRGYCIFLGRLVAFGVQQTPSQTISCGSFLTKKWRWCLSSSDEFYLRLGS